ncbi:MAG: hypothetical protein CR985_00660 [Flavobacteriales bacterium]|nr:MAG: hypothetical protein CR985_00660 [Flavobacteriales bacterium]
MKTLNLFLVLLFTGSITMCAQKSPKQTADGKADGVTITIDYSAPSVRGRTIWGGLEKYNKVWRAGANENTTVKFDSNVSVNGNALAAGKYGFFIIPKEEGDWTVIFNTKNDSWGAFSYKEEEDALRVDISPEFVDDVQEQLEYSVNDKGIRFAWEKVRLFIPVSAQ